MFFQDQSIDDKGLFTFYREQAQRDDEIKRNRKLKKQLKKMQQLQKNNEQIIISPPKQLSPVKINTVKKVFSLKQYTKKQKPSHCKQRYVQSIVDMGYLARQQQSKLSLQKQKIELKFKQPSFVSRRKRYSQRLSQLKHSIQHQTTMLREDSLAEEMRIALFKRKDRLVDVMSNRIEMGTHTMLSSFEMPEIRKSGQKIHYRPKKSIKSKIILQALKMNDKDKIKSIRDQITGRMMLQFPLVQQYPSYDYYGQLESKALQCGIQEPKGALSMLGRLKRRL